MKQAVKFGLPVCLLLVLAAAGCKEETAPVFTRLIINPECGVAPLEIEGYATVSGGDESGVPTGGNSNLEMTWDYDDGTTSSTSISYHVFDKPGIYNVSVTATDPDGKTTNISMPVTVRADTLNVDASSNVHADNVNEEDKGLVATGEEIYFTVIAESCDIDPAVDDNYRNLSFIWRMPGGYEFYARNPVFAFDTAGEYDVSVEVFLPALAVVRHSSIHFVVTDP